MHRKIWTNTINLLCTTHNHIFFSPPEVNRSIMGPLILPKKLEVDVAWEIIKGILGWLLDSIEKTIQLPKTKMWCAHHPPTGSEQEKPHDSKLFAEY